MCCAVLIVFRRVAAPAFRFGARSSAQCRAGCEYYVTEEGSEHRLLCVRVVFTSGLMQSMEQSCFELYNNRTHLYRAFMRSVLDSTSSNVHSVGSAAACSIFKHYDIMIMRKSL